MRVRSCDSTASSTCGCGANGVSFFGRDGSSLVAGRAAFVPAGGDPVAAATAAVRAGAAAVVLYGMDLPPGALGLADEIGVPVVTCMPLRSSVKTPDMIFAASGSCRCVVKRDCPGRRRSSSR